MSTTTQDAATIGLPQLIDRHKGARSFVTLQRDGGGTPNATGWHDYASGKRVPDPKNVPAIAAALHISPAEVWTAMGVTLGFIAPRTAPESTPALVAALDGLDIDVLDAEQINIVVTIVRGLVNLRH